MTFIMKSIIYFQNHYFLNGKNIRKILFYLPAHWEYDELSIRHSHKKDYYEACMNR